MIKPFDIFIIYISWGYDGKTRPVLAFITGENTVDVYQITSKYESKSEIVKAQYFKIDNWAQAGLNVQSYIDTGTLITLEFSALRGKNPIGKLTENDKQRFLEFLS